MGVQHTTAMSYPVPYDLGLIRITDADLKTSNGTIVKRKASNKLYLNDINNPNYSGSLVGTSYVVKNDIVNKSGVATEVTQGIVDHLNTKVQYTNYRPIYCVKVRPYGSTINYSSSGDSGAPTYKHGGSGNKKYLVGIHSGGSGNIGYFTNVEKLYSAFGSSFRLYVSGNEVILD